MLCPPPHTKLLESGYAAFVELPWPGGLGQAASQSCIRGVHSRRGKACIPTRRRRDSVGSADGFSSRTGVRPTGALDGLSPYFHGGTVKTPMGAESAKRAHHLDTAKVLTCSVATPSTFRPPSL